MMDWIKISSGLFDDDKIRLLNSAKNGDEMICTWIQLLCLAGKLDNDGVFTIGKRPYSIEELAIVLGRDPKRFKVSVERYEDLGMIAFDNGCVTITNWGKYQSDSKARDDYRKAANARMQRFRDRQRDATKNVTCDVTERHTLRHVTPVEEEKEIEKENNIDIYTDSELRKLAEQIALRNDHPGNIAYINAVERNLREGGEEAVNSARKEFEIAKKAKAENPALNYQQHTYSEDDFKDLYYNLGDYPEKESSHADG